MLYILGWNIYIISYRLEDLGVLKKSTPKSCKKFQINLVFFFIVVYDIIRIIMNKKPRGEMIMKKVIAIFLVMICLFSMYSVYASSTQVIDNQTSSQLVQIKDKGLKELEDYNEAYGSESYGLTAYILNKVRLYSIPCCFVGIAISAIYQYVIGVRKIDVRDRGLQLMIGFVTIFVIAQVLPLIFAIVVKSWRG